MSHNIGAPREYNGGYDECRDVAGEMEVIGLQRCSLKPEKGKLQVDRCDENMISRELLYSKEPLERLEFRCVMHGALQHFCAVRPAADLTKTSNSI